MDRATFLAEESAAAEEAERRYVAEAQAYNASKRARRASGRVAGDTPELSSVGALS